MTVTDETRAELLRSLEAVMRAADHDMVVATPLRAAGQGYNAAEVTAYIPADVRPADLPELPPEKVFALKVLVGDPASLPQALADYLMDIGHDATMAAYERGKREQILAQQMSRYESLPDDFVRTLRPLPSRGELYALLGLPEPTPDPAN